MEKFVTGEITHLAFGGEGIMRCDHRVVFVPFSAPGDFVTCRITEEKKNFAKAEIVKFESASPFRITPKCPQFGKCGGCQLQHLPLSTQLEHKKQWVEDAFIRIGDLSFHPLPAIEPATWIWEYRRHISLSLKIVGSVFQAGYIALDNKTLIPIPYCPLFLESHSPILTQLQEVVRAFHAIHGNEGKVFIFKKSPEEFLFHFQFRSLPKNALEHLEKAMVRHPSWLGVSAKDPHHFFSLGNSHFDLTIEGLKFRYSPQAFLQNHPETSLKIYKTILEYTKSHHKILDLYCGIGISTLLLAAQGKQVIGIEGNPEAIFLAKSNAKANQIKSAQFFRADVKRVLKKWLNSFCPDLLIVNPPRTGLNQQIIDNLLERGPREILYLSCMPPTLARDLKLLKGGYKIANCQAFDMFPQTSHVETLVHLVRR
jgi:23S rRNA (uracil1939-C5)-methyltransferase